MAKRYLKRRFTLRETILLCILLAVLLLGLYFGLVFYPIQSRTQEFNKQLSEAENDLNDVQKDFAEYQSMKDELARIEMSGDDTIMPESTPEHELELQAKIDEILFGIDYRYRESTATEDGVKKRTVSLTFTVNETNKRDEEMTVYQKTRSILIALISTPYRSSMSSFSLNPSGSDLKESTAIGVTATIEFFELAKEQS